jgi:C-terminal processing protease CtpA/Prc
MKSKTVRLLALIASVFFATLTWPQKISNYDRDRALSMLSMVTADVKKHYYDPKYNGFDWDAGAELAKKKIADASSFNMALSDIAGALDALNDSHTFFLPPQRPYRHDFGWESQMIGERCYIALVRPKSDAESKSLKPGDEVLTINGFKPTRENLWKMDYLFRALRPQPGLRLQLRTPAGEERQVDVMADIRPLKKVMDLAGADATFDIFELIRERENEEHFQRTRFVEFGEDLLIVKLPEFNLTQSEVDSVIGRARKRKALILDLRGNPGGSVETLKDLLGGLFAKDVTIGERVTRDSRKPLIAKFHGHNDFEGRLVVLVDSKSASASEILARVVQLEKRGVILGDHTSGSVMEAKHYNYKLGMDVVMFFGASITDANIVMGDGKSLEHSGVTPDETLLPTPTDLVSGSDPVLARAAGMAGVKITPIDAGKLFPYEWPRP